MRICGTDGSRGLSFANEMAERDDAHKTKCELCQSQSTMFSEERILFEVETPEYTVEELSICCCNENG